VARIRKSVGRTWRFRKWVAVAGLRLLNQSYAVGEWTVSITVVFITEASTSSNMPLNCVLGLVGKGKHYYYSYSLVCTVLRGHSGGPSIVVQSAQRFVTGSSYHFRKMS
jgi:hypothetical protein